MLDSRALFLAVVMVVSGQHDHSGGRRPPDNGGGRKPPDAGGRRPDPDHGRRPDWDRRPSGFVVVPSVGFGYGSYGHYGGCKYVLCNHWQTCEWRESRCNNPPCQPVETCVGIGWSQLFIFSPDGC